MKKLVVGLSVVMLAGLVLTACVPESLYTCTDPLGCITVGNAANIKIGSLLTMSGPDSVYGIDAVRGVEIAIADKRQVFGHSIELVKADDLCTEAGGQKGATDLAADPQIAGVDRYHLFQRLHPRAAILTAAHMTLISPSSTAPSLTDPAVHQAGFLRSIYNDKAQGKAVAEFAFDCPGDSPDGHRPRWFRLSKAVAAGGLRRFQAVGWRLYPPDSISAPARIS